MAEALIIFKTQLLSRQINKSGAETEEAARDGTRVTTADPEHTSPDGIVPATTGNEKQFSSAVVAPENIALVCPCRIICSIQAQRLKDMQRHSTYIAVNSSAFKVCMPICILLTRKHSGNPFPATALNIIELKAISCCAAPIRNYKSTCCSIDSTPQRRVCSLIVCGIGSIIAKCSSIMRKYLQFAVHKANTGRPFPQA